MHDLQEQALERIRRAAAGLSTALADVNGPYDQAVISRAVLAGLSSSGLRFAQDKGKRIEVAQALAGLGREARAELGDPGLDGELDDQNLDAAIWQFLEFSDHRDWTPTELAEGLARHEIPVWCTVPRAKERLSALETQGRAKRAGERDGESTWVVAESFHHDQ